MYLASRWDPKEWHNWSTLGLAHYRAGDWHAAVQALTTAAQLRASSGRTRFVLAMAHWQLGNPADARRFYDRAVELLPKGLTGPTQAHRAEELTRLRAEAARLLGIDAKR